MTTQKTSIQPIILHETDPQTLIEHCKKTIEAFQSENSEQLFQNLSEKTKHEKIPFEHARMGFIADSIEEVISLLQTGIESLEKQGDQDSWSLRKGVHYRRQEKEHDDKIVALFPGQGSQYVDMGKELIDAFPQVKEVIDGMDALFQKDGLAPLSEIIFPAPAENKVRKKEQESQLTLTQHAQPAIGAFSVGLFKVLQSMWLDVDMVAGHSFGELTALWSGGVLTDEDYLFLAKARGKAMAPVDDPEFDTGTMMAVKAEAELIEAEMKNLPEIHIANLNSNSQVVLAGGKAAIKEASSYLKEKGHSIVMLPVSAAFHTPLVGHAQQPFAEAIRSINFHLPHIPIYSNTSGGSYPNDTEAMKIILEEHILNAVLFKNEIEKIYKDGGRIFIEVGPKNVLTNLVTSILGDKPHTAIAVNASAGKKDSVRQLYDAWVQLHLVGLGLQWI